MCRIFALSNVSDGKVQFIRVSLCWILTSMAEQIIPSVSTTRHAKNVVRAGWRLYLYEQKHQDRQRIEGVDSLPVLVFHFIDF